MHDTSYTPFMSDRHLYFLSMKVHVVPAHMFRKVISLTKSHCKLGLTGTNYVLCACPYFYFFPQYCAFEL